MPYTYTVYKHKALIKKLNDIDGFSMKIGQLRKVTA